MNYYLLGKAIATGRGYVTLNLPDEPAHNHFPPGYPAIVAVVMHLISNNILAVKIVNGVFFVLAVWLLFLLLEKWQVNRHITFVVMLFILLNTHFLRSSTIMMSEVPFFLMSTIAIFLFSRMDLARSPLKNPVFYFFILSLSFAYYIRTAGIALFGGLLLYLILNKRWQFFLTTLAGFVMLAMPWYLRGHSLGGSKYLMQLVQVNPYRAELGLLGMGDLIRRVAGNFTRYVTKEIPNGMLPFIQADYSVASGFIEWVIGIILISLIVYGLVRMNTKIRLLIMCYLLGAFGILLLWPDVWYGVRFFLPVLPFLILGLIKGTHDVISLIMRKWLPNLHPTPLILLLVLLFFIPGIRNLREQARAGYPPNYKNYFQVAAWVAENTAPEAVISCRKPGMFYLFSGRHALNYPFSLDDQKIIENFRTKGVRYVVLEQLGYGSTARYLLPAIQKNLPMFKAVYHIPNPDTYLLNFSP